MEKESTIEELEEIPLNDVIPECAWKRFLSDEFDNHKEFTVSAMEMISMAFFAYRILRHGQQEKQAHRLPVIDPLMKKFEEPIMGVPLGGIGCGTICRGWRGDFVRWSILQAGIVRSGIVPANQFSFFSSDHVTRATSPIRKRSPVSINKKAGSMSEKRSSIDSPQSNSPLSQSPPLKTHISYSPSISPTQSPSHSIESFTRQKLTPRSYSTPITKQVTNRKASVLYVPSKKNSHKFPIFNCWNFKGLKGNNSYYYGLFPQAWTVHDRDPDPDLRITCQQISPVIPNDYERSSYPAGVFVWSIKNLSNKIKNASLMFTFQNGDGSESDLKGGHYNKLYRQQYATHEIVGVKMVHKYDRHIFTDGDDKGEVFTDPVSFMIATKIEYSEFGAGIIESSRNNKKMKDRQVTYTTRFETTNVDQLKSLWFNFQETGKLEQDEDETPSKIGTAIGAALCVSDKVHPGETITITFVLAWDIPIARFNSGNAYYRRYTRFFGREGSSVEEIATKALRDYPIWARDIHNWQKPILENPNLPSEYKCALFNELYFIVDGGTVWTDSIIKEDDEIILEPQLNDFGKFFYLEGHEYLMCNTYDVHFYASYALIMLWPELELTIQRDFAEATRKEYNMDHWIISPNIVTKRKVKGAVPHDLGNPGDDPWNKPNAYNIQEIDKWKDLSCKFILQIFRDYKATKNRVFLEEMWPVIKEVVAYSLKNFDKNNDYMIENEGFPDQTYDIWSANGCSAYCGGLWVAAIKAARWIACELNDHEHFLKYNEIYKEARKIYIKLLWNGQYYNYDISNNIHNNSIQSDQMAGNWYSIACGLGGIVPYEHALSSLKTVYKYNVQGFKNGKIGIVNGVRPDGTPDKSCLQSHEIWTGITYAVIAAMLQVKLYKEGFDTLCGIVDTAYNRWGYIYDTPEAWSIDGRYRSKGYMRPLSVWAIQWVLENQQYCADDEFDRLLEQELIEKINRLLQESGVSGEMAVQEIKIETNVKEATKTNLEDSTNTNFEDETKTNLGDSTNTNVGDETKTTVEDATNTNVGDETKTNVEDATNTNIEDASKINLGDSTNTNVGDETKTTVEDATNTNVEDASITNLVD